MLPVGGLTRWERPLLERGKVEALPLPVAVPLPAPLPG